MFESGTEAVTCVMKSKPRVGPSVGELIVKAVAQALDVDKNKARVKTAFKSLVAKGTLVQTRGLRIFQDEQGYRDQRQDARRGQKAKKPAGPARNRPRKQQHKPGEKKTDCLSGKLRRSFKHCENRNIYKITQKQNMH
uniref:H15 domain-containing protein n=1 Tax=Astatotilapia calliptera TaxID=8154 RepID=A0A3P8NZN6_ASTCA